MKTETLFVCTKCDAQFSKWAGQCTECGAWGTVKEDSGNVRSAESSSRTLTARPGKIQAFTDLTSASLVVRKLTGFDPFDRLLSGGLVPGSVTLLGGEPGIGKSTLLAQLCLSLSKSGSRVLYITGEESPSQVALRFRRLIDTLPANLFFLDETNATVIAATIEREKPELTVVDSIQSLRLPEIAGEPGNPTQVRASAALITEAAKRAQVSIIFVGQVTKDGDLAGPRLLEHLVDTVMMMEGDREQTFRLLRVLKHRFGATDELAVFRMAESGLEEILDPSASLLSDRPKQAPGSIVTCLAEGSRPILIEIQALVTPAGYGTPIRRSTGIDQGRLSLLLAVLARRAGVNLNDSDVFVNAVGGVTAKEPAIDLAICLALASAKYDVPIPEQTAAWGEIGLSGEIRPVANQAGRLKEAERLKFQTCLVPRSDKIEGVSCSNLNEALNILKLRSQPKLAHTE